MIELHQIDKTFESEAGQVGAVRQVSLHIEQGDIFGIIGFSGAGKSTLVRCINLLEPPTSGTVSVDGQLLTGLRDKPLREARKKMGMIFQHFHLMRSRTVFGNVAYPLWRSGLSKGEIAVKVRRLLELVDIADKEKAYPSQLSGGQKQRVAIARALANDPKVLLCDEATSALDPQTTESILQLLTKLNRQLNLTIVVITHEMSVVKQICNRVAVMDGGRVVEQGEVFSIFANPKEEITKAFIRSTSNLQKIDRLAAGEEALIPLEPGQVVVRLTYTEKKVSEPLISTVSRKFNLSLNIIFADVELIQGAPIGGTVAVISGEREQITAAMAYLIEKNVSVEVIADARVSQ